MKIGILESKGDVFVNDIAGRLSGNDVQFISVKENRIEKVDFDVIFDRLSYANDHLAEYLRIASMNGTYVINNPFSTVGRNKIIDFHVCKSVGVPQPKTVALPMTDAEIKDSISEPDIDNIVKEIDLPCVVKPYDGYGWENVFVVNSIGELKNLYAALKEKEILLVQEMIDWQDYYRVFCVDKKEVLFIKYIPRPFAMGECIQSDLKPIESLLPKLKRLTIKLNQALDLDLNVVEWAIDKDGKPFVIDTFNEFPDVNKNTIPPDYYNWIIEKICGCITSSSHRKNKTLFPFKHKEHGKKK
jgi:hypothetical protein